MLDFRHWHPASNRLTVGVRVPGAAATISPFDVRHHVTTRRSADTPPARSAVRAVTGSQEVAPMAVLR